MIFDYRHGGFYGSENHAEHGCRRSENYLKGLPCHEYEIDMDKQEALDREERTSKMSVQSSASSTGLVCVCLSVCRVYVCVYVIMQT